MASQIEISNFALVGLGADPISALTEQTNEALTINVAWDICRRSLLRAHYWNFAIVRIELAQSSIAPNHGYQYKFALPSDCLRVIQVYQNNDYKLENGFIVTNTDRVKLKYVADIKDTTYWSADFTELMVDKLKAEIAFSVTRDKDLVQLSHQILNAKLAQANWTDASEDIEDAFLYGSTSLIEVR
jgi:hypothetical protein